MPPAALRVAHVRLCGQEAREVIVAFVARNKTERQSLGSGYPQKAEGPQMTRESCFDWRGVLKPAWREAMQAHPSPVLLEAVKDAPRKRKAPHLRKQVGARQGQRGPEKNLATEEYRVCGHPCYNDQQKCPRAVGAAGSVEASDRLDGSFWAVDEEIATSPHRSDPMTLIA